MKALGVAFLTLFMLYVLTYFQILPYRFVSSARLAALEGEPGAPAALSLLKGDALTGNQLIAEYHGALLLVEGQKGVGSGFLCNMNGHTYAITNAHVLGDNAGVKLTSLDNVTFTPGVSAIAVGHDAVKLEVTSVAKAFEFMPDPDINAKVGDAVIVLGNAEGGGVVRPIEGKILGIGPDLIEVDTRFEKGDSGSPIIHAATGKVIGIATYLVDRKITPAGVKLGARRFGYRLDTVTAWESINWPAFFSEAAQVAQIKKLSEDFIKMSNELAGRTLTADNYSDPKLRQVISSYLQDISYKNLSSSDKINYSRNLIAELRSDTRADIAAFNTHPAYDYFHREVEDEGRFRDELYDSLTRMMTLYQQ